MSSIVDDLKFQFKTGNVLLQLIIVNCSVFLAVNLVRLVLVFSSGQLEGNAIYGEMLEWVSMPTVPVELLLKPWTLITYMFLHSDIWHIVGNMLMFYFFGRIFQEYLGTRKLFPVYFYGGLAGALFAFIAYNTIPALTGLHATLLGASAGVMSVILATTTLLPEYSVSFIFIGEVRLKYIAAFFILLDILSVSYFENIGGHFAHLGGALFGFIFTRQLQKGNDLAAGFNNLLYSTRSLFKTRNKKNKMNVSYKNATRKKDPNKLTSIEKQKRIDEILDKISKSGYESLSKDEKDELFKMSN